MLPSVEDQLSQVPNNRHSSGSKQIKRSNSFIQYLVFCLFWCWLLYGCFCCLFVVCMCVCSSILPHKHRNNSYAIIKQHGVIILMRLVRDLLLLTEMPTTATQVQDLDQKRGNHDYPTWRVQLHLACFKCYYLFCFLPLN
jgi:hypothetical protein